jgi:hypothetical protein
MIGFDLPMNWQTCAKIYFSSTLYLQAKLNPILCAFFLPLALSKAEADMFLEALAAELKQTVAS